MVRWVVCGFASVLACSVPNPQFAVDDEQTTTSSETSSTGSSDPPGATTTDESSGAVTPDTTTGDTTEAPPSTSTTTAAETTSTTTAADTTTTGDTTTPGPCTDICGTPGCGECPGGAMVPFPGFTIDAREASNSEYQQFLAAAQDPAMQPGQCAWNDDYTPSTWPASDTLPVVGIDWCDARAYCAWSGKRLCGAIDGGPAKVSQFTDSSKNQWYRACSNGDGRDYPYGHLYNALACNGADALLAGLIDVGSLLGCEAPVAGIFDLSGNVWEWVDTCTGDGPDAECVRRGGSYYSDLDELRCDLYSKRPRSTAVHYVGVRCCSL